MRHIILTSPFPRGRASSGYFLVVKRRVLMCRVILTSPSPRGRARAPPSASGGPLVRRGSSGEEGEERPKRAWGGATDRPNARARATEREGEGAARRSRVKQREARQAERRATRSATRQRGGKPHPLPIRMSVARELHPVGFTRPTTNRRRAPRDTRRHRGTPRDARRARDAARPPLSPSPEAWRRARDFRSA